MRRLPVSSTGANCSDWTDPVSTGVLRLGISCRDVLFKQAQAFPVDSMGGVQIAVVMDATGARPLAIAKREVGIDPPTRATRFGGGKEPADRDQVLVLPLGLVCQHRSEQPPPGIQNASGQLAFRKARYVQIFNRNEVITTDQIGAQLVQEISALIADLLVQSRNYQPRFATVATASELAAERLLCAPEFSGLDTILARVLDRFATRQHRQRLQADVKTNVRLHVARNLWRNLLLNDQTDEPMPTRLALEGRTLRHSFKRPVEDQLDQTQLRNRDE